MNLYDISVELSDSLPSWPGEARFEKKENHYGDICVSEINMTLHAGTHFDAPYHFLPEGKKLCEIPLERFMGRVMVCEISSMKSISFSEIREKNLEGVNKILFKTSNSGLWNKKVFNKKYIGLEYEAASYLVDHGIDLIGIDYLSVESFDSDSKVVHKLLLSNDVLILEGLNLINIPEKNYFLFSCPLKIKDAEAAPVRAFLLPDSYCKDAKNVSASMTVF